ncbi:TIGR02678 family protein [Nocardia sp. NPDC058666]|uniref:TIGR02678 family protein n=1 Tax=Nocardia sp. NPDC058666 TaxID=3346587 RepID=UPI0036628013
MTPTRDEVDRRRAFTALLANPVLDRKQDRDLFALVNDRRHRSELMTWFSHRLGYRLVVTDSAARLFRLPLGDTVIAPERVDPPSRRTLVLTLLAGAAAEDAEDITTTQDLSDRVRVLSNRPDVGVAVYEPDRFAERKLFAAAVDLLVTTGALAPVGVGGESGDGWARRADRIGRTYEVRREMLLRMIDPASLAAALGERGPVVHEAAERFAVMRRLVELPVCLYQDLTEPERAYLIHQRSRIVGWCAEMTGWTVEQRSEGLALIAADEGGTDLPFPRLRAVDFAALLVLDELFRCQADTGTVTETDVAAAVAEVAVRHPKAITAEIKTDSQRRERVLELLGALDLIRPSGEGRWRVMPPAARFRNPQVLAVTARIEEGNND